MDVNEAILVVDVAFVEKVRSIESHYRAMIDMYSSPGIRDALGLMRVLRKRDQEINEARLRREMDISRLRERWSISCEEPHEHMWVYGRAMVQGSDFVLGQRGSDLVIRHTDYRKCSCGREEIADPYANLPFGHSWIHLGDGDEENRIREIELSSGTAFVLPRKMEVRND